MEQRIVLIVGINAGGKTSIVWDFTNQGFERVNRDEIGGKIVGLLPIVENWLIAGKSVVLDNTFPTIESREPFIALGKKYKVPVDCVWLKTSLEDAQFNASWRMIDRRKKLLGPDELKKSKDPNVFPPIAQYNYRKQFSGEAKDLKYPGKQIPETGHGFRKVEEREFVRLWTPEFCNKAIILDADDTVRRSKGPSPWPTNPKEVEVLPGRKEVLARYKKQGYLILGASNQSAVAKGMPLADAIACFDRTNELLGLKVDWQFCPHKVPPVSCFCRKPSPGMGVAHILTYRLDPKQCIMVGDSTSDRTFATRCGFQFQTPEVFFGP